MTDYETLCALVQRLRELDILVPTQGHGPEFRAEHRKAQRDVDVFLATRRKLLADERQAKMF